MEQQVVQENSSSPNNLVLLDDMHSSKGEKSDIKLMVQNHQGTKLKEKESIKFEINHGFEDAIQADHSQHEMKKKTMTKTRQSILSVLEENAKKGDPVSSKIYIHLYDKIPEAIFKE